jgi:hypothetical protein
MRLNKKKPDPLSDRSKMLNDQIEALQGEIKQLSQALDQSKKQPRMRSTAYPAGSTSSGSSPASSSNPVFESIDHNRLQDPKAGKATPDRVNELGVKKLDLPALWHRFRELFHGPAPANPKLVSFLAAGSVQGLRPLRIEKRIARRRFLLLAGILFLLLWGLAYLFFRK